jgi:hypothetical protein
MAQLDWSQCPAVESLRNLQDMSVDELTEFAVTREQNHQIDHHTVTEARSRDSEAARYGAATVRGAGL